jgi:hypothetical protein
MAALGPADKPVNVTIAVMITIHGVLTNNNSKKLQLNLENYNELLKKT